LGDIFSVRIAGNVTSRKILGSAEYGCAVAGAKLILVMGHTRCGAVTTAVNLICSNRTAVETTGCQHLDYIINDIQQSTDPATCRGVEARPAAEKESFVNAVAHRNVSRVVEQMREQSQTLDGLVRERRIAIVGAMYDVVTGEIEFLADNGMNHVLPPEPGDRTSEEDGRLR
jgi:carbonic anhydrase